MNLLTTKDLNKSFGGLHAVANVNFELPKGQVRALIGPNGAGKSTLVGLLCGRIPADTGKIQFDGKEISHLPAHQRIRLGMAYTFQITSVFARLSVHENVALAVRRARAGSASETNNRVEEVLQLVGLSGREDQQASELSYGHQRLLEIAMGIGQDPKLFIFDEPTQGLSQGEIDNFMALVANLSKDATILLIEHNMDVVMGTADYISVLNFGEILAEGTPEDIRTNKKVQTAYLGGEA